MVEPDGPVFRSDDEALLIGVDPRDGSCGIFNQEGLSLRSVRFGQQSDEVVVAGCEESAAQRSKGKDVSRLINTSSCISMTTLSTHSTPAVLGAYITRLIPAVWTI